MQWLAASQGHETSDVKRLVQADWAEDPYRDELPVAFAIRYFQLQR